MPKVERRTKSKNKRTRSKSKRTTQKRPSTTEQDKLFSSPPPLRSKNTSRLSLKTSPLFETSSLVSLKTSLPRHQLPFTLRAGHAPTRIYAPAHSANFPFLPSPFTSPRNKLCINRLSVKANPAFTFTFTATS